MEKGDPEEEVWEKDANGKWRCSNASNSTDPERQWQDLDRMSFDSSERFSRDFEESPSHSQGWIPSDKRGATIRQATILAAGDAASPSSTRPRKSVHSDHDSNSWEGTPELRPARRSVGRQPTLPAQAHPGLTVPGV